ncbi:hypothetical protein M9Y10_044362 [Tritrichomonas musculus]|uniref:Protein kinase domain-containing protein n=1 Tax=Tritrichomonas musculus TaxID=1915356 RepID=A0ABR2GQK4_9EUKA
MLGQGSFGTVFVANNINEKKQYAAKIININEKFDWNDQMILLRESIILYKLDHPSIIKFKGINFRSFTDSSIFQPTIITEFMPHGSLKDNLNKEKRSMSDLEWNATKKYIMLIGVSDAMRYLHSHGIIHRDLKPENILVDSDYYPRVCDFGLSRCFSGPLSKSMKLTMTGQIGTPLYMAPELLRGEEHYGTSVDVYAFSIIAYEIVSGKQSYFELDETISPFVLGNKIMEGYRPKYAKGITKKMWNLLCRCWDNRPEKRPTFDGIFNELSTDISSYFSENIDEDELFEYLEKLSDRKEQSDMHTKEDDEATDSLKELQNEIKKLKLKISEYEDEHKKLFMSNPSLSLGLILILGPKKSNNYNRAVFQLNQSSEKGNRYASFILGLLYESEIVEKDMKKSFMYYKKSSKQGNPKGFNRIGLCFNDGLGVKQDYSKALEFYQKAAELGDASAMTNIGYLYYDGQGVKQDYSKAFDYYKKAAKLGNMNALNCLGILFKNGQGVTHNYSKALKCYQKAAESGEPHALVNLGMMYENGQGVEQDLPRAIQIYKKVSELGHPDAAKNLKDLQKKLK